VSANIGELVDRIYREYLEPMDDLQPYTLLQTIAPASDGINNSDTTLQFDGTLLTQEEEDVMEAGSIIEIDRELMLCKELDTVNDKVTVVRGVRGTTATAHSDGAVIKIAPPFPRQVVFDAVCDQIKNLFPSLFAVETKTVTVSDGYTLLGSYDSPGTNNYLVSILKGISQFTDFSAGADTTTTLFSNVAVELIQLPNPFTYTDDTGTERTITYTSGPSQVMALQFSNIADGHTAYITFKKKFIEPTAETDTLATIGLEDEYEPIIMTGVAAQMMSGRDIPTATADYITDQMSIQNFPVGSAASIRNSLLRYQQVLLTQAKKYLKAKYPDAVVMNGVNIGVQ